MFGFYRYINIDRNDRFYRPQ